MTYLIYRPTTKGKEVLKEFTAQNDTEAIKEFRKFKTPYKAVATLVSADGRLLA